MQVELPFGEVKRCFRLVNDLFGSRCFRDLLDTGIYPDMKEMTESAAVIWALKHRVKDFSLSDPQVTAFCVGDGATPRTGAMLAFRSKWFVFSIDPLLPKSGVWPGVNRLAMLSKPVEEVTPITSSKVVIVAVHSHAPLQASVDRFLSSTQRIVIAIPCCVPQTIENIRPDVEYRDDGIWSPQNKVKIWRL